MVNVPEIRKTALDTLIENAAESLRELKRLDTARKLNFDAFLAEALAIAGCKAQRIAEVEKIIETKAGTEAIARFLRVMTTKIRESQMSRPFPDPSKAVRIYGDDSVAGEMGQHGIRAGEVQALAVRRTKARFGEDVFGTMDDFGKHRAKTEKLRAKLEAFYAQMRSAFAGADVLIDIETLTSTERAAGLCRVTFRRAPGVSPAYPDWPRLLIEDFERAVPKPRFRTRLPEADATNATAAA